MMAEGKSLFIGIKEDDASNMIGFKQKEFYRSYLRFIVEKRNELYVTESLHTKIVRLFHEKVIDSIYKKLYVFKMPFGLGALCIGEEINRREFFWIPIRQEDGTIKRQKVPNVGLLKIFRFWWNKESCNVKNADLYYLYICHKHKKKLGRHILEQNSNVELKNYRAHLIYRNR